MILRHLHLPGIVPYNHASKLQDILVKNLLAHKANPQTIHAPDPTIITAQFHPVYTCGRREVGTVSPSQKQYLEQATPYGKAEFIESLRGGQTTFHGPGQLIAYPILDLKRHNLTPRSYVCLLEKSVIATCAHYGVKAMGTENPGVWTDEDHKICALGVHLRRNVTSHGIGFNVDTELGWFERIVGCGLEGKKATSLREQGVKDEVDVESVAGVFVRKMWERLEGVDASIRVPEQSVK
ncbi:putative octanoyltransferase [Pseudocercospora fuligena]|uniref:Octanoyltransferase n=1 Tax=Pseudocercospora fuligena TaxID=685502 RepID=A0A8H6R9L6_9PEZI|nr:putative octanoyltransferase [Pseudocercospora fuligena]